MRSFEERSRSYREMIEHSLAGSFAVKDPSWPMAGLAEAMRYSLLAGGKRVRAMLVLAFCEAAGGSAEKALPVACAVEMLHCYSLIHDDLPCMDDGKLRRGKPTNHLVFGEANAVLAGDALQAEAFGSILRAPLSARRRADCAEALADAAGIDGMCCGQYMDLAAEGKLLTEEELDELDARKTGALLIAACRMGVCAAGGTKKQLEAASLYGAAVGTAFQIRDDMLDALSTESELGKTTGADARVRKNTCMALYGEAECRRRIGKLTAYAKETLRGVFAETEFLSTLADRLADRKK